MTKILTALVYPTGLLLVFFVLSQLFKWSQHTVCATFCKGGFAAVLILSTNPMIASCLVASLEQQYPQRPFNVIEEHDAIIVLGGGLAIPLPPALHIQLVAGSDRYWHAAQLYRAGKAKKIFITGGNLFQQRNEQGEPLKSEAYYARQLLIEWGVKGGDIVIEGDSRTTEQNRANLSLLIAEHEVSTALLVTSAIHMPRAVNLFSELPLLITPASADVMNTYVKRPRIFEWLPSVAAMQMTTKALHEYYGLSVLTMTSWFK